MKNTKITNEQLSSMFEALTSQKIIEEYYKFEQWLIDRAIEPSNLSTAKFDELFNIWKRDCSK